jgi:hypothetical protein
MDFFTVPTITFGVLYCFFVIGHDRRKILRCNVTRYPGAPWIVQQMRESVAIRVDAKILAFRSRLKVWQRGDVRCQGVRKRAGAYLVSQPLAERRRGALGGKLPPRLVGSRDRPQRPTSGATDG